MNHINLILFLIFIAILVLNFFVPPIGFIKRKKKSTDEQAWKDYRETK